MFRIPDCIPSFYSTFHYIQSFPEHTKLGDTSSPALIMFVSALSFAAALFGAVVHSASCPSAVSTATWIVPAVTGGSSLATKPAVAVVGSHAGTTSYVEVNCPSKAGGDRTAYTYASDLFVIRVTDYNPQKAVFVTSCTKHGQAGECLMYVENAPTTENVPFSGYETAYPTVVGAVPTPYPVGNATTTRPSNGTMPGGTMTKGPSGPGSTGSGSTTTAGNYAAPTMGSHAGSLAAGVAGIMLGVLAL